MPTHCAEGHRKNRSDRLVGSVIVALVEGNLKPGDPFPQPDELARVCHMPLHEVLDSIGLLMRQRVLRQDGSGSLCIHPRATPTLDMKQFAFLVRARQLVDQARQWHLPCDGLSPIFDHAVRDAR